MIHLEHLNLVVKDIDKSLDFYRVVFPHWKIRGGGKSDWYGKLRNWLHFGDDHQYLALADNGIGENRDLKQHQVGLAHFAYVTNNIKDLVQRLTQAGYETSSDLDINEHRGNVYYLDPDGFEVEFVEYFRDQPHLRNSGY